jgi:competence protein ComEC
MAHTANASELALSGTEVSACVAGMHWEWDGVAFDILHPTPNLLTPETADNAKSCVLKISNHQNSALLPGDIGVAEEQSLLTRLGPEMLQSTILLAPHHGSNSSSSQAFIESVQPKWVVFQVGYRNRYGHPKTEVVQRYENFGCANQRTDQTGAIQLRLNKDNLHLNTARLKNTRYWQHIR